MSYVFKLINENMEINLIEVILNCIAGKYIHTNFNVCYKFTTITTKKTNATQQFEQHK